MCAVHDPEPGTAAPTAPRRRITPLQWVGLAVLLLLLANQMGLLRFSSATGVDDLLYDWLPRALAIVLAITVHEFSHGLMATAFGDTVPRRAGRLTLNPLKHLDPLGTILIFTGAPIGWGRPMPIDPNQMRNPYLGWSLSSIAGPLSNLLMASLTAIVLKLAFPNGPRELSFPLIFGLWFVLVNVGLATFNLVPLAPLDGFGFVYGLAPPWLRRVMDPLRQYSPMILLALILLPSLVRGFPSVLTIVLGPLQQFFLNALGMTPWMRGLL